MQGENVASGEKWHAYNIANLAKRIGAYGSGKLVDSVAAEPPATFSSTVVS
jgi:hypothetical protein